MSKVSLYTFKIEENFLRLPSPESFLGVVDLKQLAHISNVKRRKEFLVARYIAKCILGDVYSLKNPKISYSSNGKPRTKSLALNWAHSKDQAVLAVSKSLQLGVDLEIGIQAKNIAAVSKTFFSFEEYKYIFAVKNERQQMLRFQRLWSLKESCVKAIGKKLNKKSIQSYFDLKQKKVIGLPTKRSLQFFLHAKKALSVCVVGSCKTIECFSVSINSKGLKISRRQKEIFYKFK